MMGLCAILCGVTLSKIKLDSQFHQEEQDIFSEGRFWINFYISMDFSIFLGHISSVQKAFSFYSEESFRLFGQLQIIYIEWEI